VIIFFLYDLNTKTLLERGEYHHLDVSNISIAVSYKCFDDDFICPIQPEDYRGPIYNFLFKRIYQKFDIDFQNKEKPVALSEYVLSETFVMNPNIMTELIDEWQIIKIKEEKGMLDNFFGNEKDSIGGTFFRQKMSYKNNLFLPSSNSTDYKYSKIFFIYRTINTYINYAEYSRKKVSLFSLIANICSFAFTIYNGFCLSFNYLYSENFSNYKVIYNILTS